MKFKDYLNEERTVKCHNCGNTFKTKKPKGIATKCFKCGNNVEYKQTPEKKED